MEPKVYYCDFIHFWSVTLVSTIKTTSFTPPSVIKLHLWLIQHQEDQTNTKDNIPPIEEATERKPYGLRIF
jgi:hypothetical protein